MTTYYTPSGAPANNSPGTSALIRAEFLAIAAGFALLPGTLNANAAVIVNSSGTAMITTTGGLALAADFALTGGQTVTIQNSTGPVTLTVPVASDTLVGRASTDTLTNKSISGSTNTLSSIANASLINSSITINGTTISLGGSGTITAAAASIAVTTTGITGGTSGRVLFDNAGALGEYSISGSGNVVMTTSPTITTPTLNSATLVTPALGTPASGTLTNCTGYTASNLGGLGTGVGTWLATPSSVNLAAAMTDKTGSGSLVFASSPTLVTPVLGTPTSGNLANCTGYTVSNLGGLGLLVADFLATPSAGNLEAAVTSTTGSGALVFAVSPSLTAPTIGAATATSVNKVAITQPASAATLTIANNKTLTASNTLTFTGTDGSSVAFGAGGTVLYDGGALGTPSSGTLTNCSGLPISGIAGLGTGVGTWLATPSSANLAAAITDETGTGALVFANTPTLVTPVLGTPTSGTLTNCTGLPPTGVVTGTMSMDAYTASTSNLNDQIGTSYTLQSSDNGKQVTLSNASAITLTVPSGLTAGFSCTIIQKGAGQVTITPSSTTLHNRSGLKTAGQYAAIGILYETTNTYFVCGDATV